MLIIWIRNIVIVFVLLSLVYVMLSLRGHLKKREMLEGDFVKADKNKDNTLSKEEFVAQGMAKYNRSFKSKLIFGVFLVPLAALAVLLYLAHYS